MTTSKEVQTFKNTYIQSSGSLKGRITHGELFVVVYTEKHSGLIIPLTVLFNKDSSQRAKSEQKPIDLDVQLRAR